MIHSKKESVVAVVVVHVVVVTVNVVAIFCKGKKDRLTFGIISLTDAIDININCV